MRGECTTARCGAEGGGGGEGGGGRGGEGGVAENKPNLTQGVRKKGLEGFTMCLRSETLQNPDKTLVTTYSKPVFMTFPGPEPVQFDMEKLFLLAVSTETLKFRGNI